MTEICRRLAVVGVLCVGLFAVRAASGQPRPSPPNFVLCMADDQGWGDMAYQGHPVLKTPVFDEMSRTGLRLDCFYAAAPVCSPTRASVLTGRTPNRMGAFSWGYNLRPGEVTLAEALKEGGYRTGHFGKWHLGSVRADSPVSPGNSGFDEWLSSPNFFEIDPWMSDQGKAVRLKGEGSQVIVSRALEFIRRSRDSGKPFLAVVWFGSPHAPHVGTPEDIALYPDQTPRQQRFLAEITAMDRAMGQLREGLKSAGVANNTLLWYNSDNGAIAEGSTGGLRGRKSDLYEGGLRVPALVEWPSQIRKPRASRARVGTVDLFPTLLELAGLKPGPAPLDGVSLVPLLRNEKWVRPRPLGFWDYQIPGIVTPSTPWLERLAAEQAAGRMSSANEVEPIPAAQTVGNYSTSSFPRHSAWIDGDWKLHRIEPRGQAVRWELYRLDQDEKETTDLATREPERVASMRAALESWLRSVVSSLNGADYPLH